MTMFSRYEALGIPVPDVRTMCTGDCEGTGFVPVRANDKDPVYRALWHLAEQLSHAEDGWHFVPCPACGGTGQREKRDL